MALSLEEGGLSMLDKGGLTGGRRTAFRQPQAVAAVPDATTDSRRGSFGPGEGGTWAPGTGFRNTGRIRERYEDRLGGGPAAQRGAELGEPTSFRAGAGAPAPIQVMSGGERGFVAPGGGPSYATPLQAQQKWNQGMRGEAVAAGDRRGFTTPEATLDTQYGGFREPGQTGKEIAARAHVEGSAAAVRNPYYEAMAGKVGAETAGLQAGVAKVDRAKVTTDFDTLMHESPYSTFDTGKGKTEFKAKDESQYRDYLASKNLALQQGDPTAGRKHFEERQMVRQWLQTQSLQPGFNADAALDAAASNPEHWQGLVADARKVLGFSRPAAAQGGSAMEQLGKIGEHITPTWMKPVEGVNY